MTAAKAQGTTPELTKKTKKKVSPKKKAPKIKNLVVVESPTKAKTIEKYLGKQFTVKASFGHLRDLPKSQFGIDIENHFAPKYINIRGRGDIIRDLKQDAKKADKIFLASDPDREGEAIAWHLAYILGIDETKNCRIIFNEITKPAIQQAIKNPQPINLDRVDAQQARRFLDRIVGYKLSPLLWKKVRSGLSAGRVQSVTMKLICDREKEIENFISEEYWTIEGKFKKGRSKIFSAEFSALDGEKPDLKNRDDVEKILAELKTREKDFFVQDVKTQTRHKKPSAPFYTSSLQQEAARHLGFNTRKTMSVAQQLYEGVHVGKEGLVGLITYMRTDSTRIAQAAITQARDFVSKNFGKEFLPASPNIYAAGKKAQDAHEGIRPTSVAYTPEMVSPYLTNDQKKLYTLIWQRFVACQMTPAIYDTVTATISAGEDKKFLFKATGSLLKFEGFTKIYHDDKNLASSKKNSLLPDLQTGDKLNFASLVSEQHFTEPPARYNEASLVKTLEEKEIGRPSTYAPIVSTILSRGYVTKREQQFVPTELGTVVVDLLEEYFKDIVDVQFTANLENELDEIAEGKLDKNQLLEEFYGPFSKTLEAAEKAIGAITIQPEVSDVPCEKCGAMMVIKQGKHGKFLACPNYPNCRTTKPLLKKTGAACPVCGDELVETHSHTGKIFYVCSHKQHPDCKFMTWDAPQKKKCPSCGSTMFKHVFKNGRSLLYCANDSCKTRENHPLNKYIAEMKSPEMKSSSEE